MQRKDFQRLANIRLDEAKILLDNRKYNGAYYLSGYVVECALKSCISKTIKKFEFPDKKLASDCYTHDLTKLIRIARLENELDHERNNNEGFRVNWNIVKDWTEESRYKKYNRSIAFDMYTAVSDLNDGVLQWLRRHW